MLVQFKENKGSVIGVAELTPGGKVRFRGPMGESVRQTNVVEPDTLRRLTPEHDGEAYLRALPHVFRSPYFFAVLVDGGDVAKSYNPQQPRDKIGRWTADYSGLNDETAKHLESALDYGQEYFADMSGLQIGPQGKVANGTPYTRQYMTTFGSRDKARAIGYDPTEMSNVGTFEDSLHHQQETGWLTIPDARGVAYHEVGHVVRRRNPVGGRVSNDIANAVRDAIARGTLTREQLRAAVGKYGESNEGELFAELFRLYATGNFPSQLDFVRPQFERLQQAYARVRHA